MIKMEFNENELLTDCNTLIQPGDAVTAQATRDQQHGHQAGEGATLAAPLPLRSADAAGGPRPSGERLPLGASRRCR